MKGLKQMFGTLFDKSKRDKEPKGAQGDIDLHNNTGHSTQYYDDEKRVSWDQPGGGTQTNIGPMMMKRRAVMIDTLHQRM